jgi:transposase-like protein
LLLRRGFTHTGKKVKSEAIGVKALLAADEELLRAPVREVLSAEMTEALPVEKGERTAARLGHRSGYLWPNADYTDWQR